MSMRSRHGFRTENTFRNNVSRATPRSHHARPTRPPKATHTDLVLQHVLTTISREKANLDLHTRLLLDQIWLSQHNRSRHASPHARFIRPSIKCLLPTGLKTNNLEESTTPRSAIDDVQLVIYLPYLHWDSFKHMQERAALIKRRHEDHRARPVDREIANGKSMENKLIWQYLKSDLPLHCRRTLDQFGYPSLRNTSVRDADQVLYKRTKVDKDSPAPREIAAKHLKHIGRGIGRQSSIAGAHEDVIAKVLMVDQLWLWVLDGGKLWSPLPQICVGSRYVDR